MYGAKKARPIFVIFTTLLGLIPVWTAAELINIIKKENIGLWRGDFSVQLYLSRITGRPCALQKGWYAMLTVMELLLFPLFRNFRLVSGYSGLYNPVTGTGILEWEFGDDFEKNFERGEFVVTTLSLARNDALMAENSIRMLIDKKVSAVAVKDVYYHEISEELKAYSDARHIPVFFFSGTFFDDIIFTIKNTILNQQREIDHSEAIDFLLETSSTPEQKIRKAHEINPFFHSRLICCFSEIKKGDFRYKDLKIPPLNPEETVYSILEYRQGVLVIYTVKAPASGLTGQSSSGEKADTDKGRLEEKLISFLEKTGLFKQLRFMGISSVFSGLENLGTAIQECLYSNLSCRSARKEMMRFRDSGLDRILLPLRHDPWIRSYYEELFSTLRNYDSLHEAKLMETLLEYINNGGDMNQTARNLFQHSNTVRYRIDKIRKLLNLDSSPDAFAQMVIFARLHQINHVLKS